MKKIINFFLLNCALYSPFIVALQSQKDTTAPAHKKWEPIDLIIEQKGVGYLIYSWQNPEVVILQKFYIEEHCRKQGWGTRLFKTFIDEVKDKNLNQIKWHIAPTHNVGKQDLRSIYSKLAARLQKELPGNYQEIEEEIHSSDHSQIRLWGIYTVKKALA